MSQTGSALSAEKSVSRLLLKNITQTTTQDASGNVYKEKEVAFEEYIKTPERRVPGYVDENLYQGVRVTDVYDDQTPGRMILILVILTQMKTEWLKCQMSMFPVK